MLQEQKPAQRQGFFAIIILLIALLIFIVLYGLPALSSISNEQPNAGWSEGQQREIAFELAQNIESYRNKINEKRRINYGDAYMSATATSTIFRPPIPFDGMNSPLGAKNDTHSEAKLKGWALTTIRKNLQNLPSGSTINVLIFTQVKVCPVCRASIQQWANQLNKLHLQESPSTYISGNKQTLILTNQISHS